MIYLAVILTALSAGLLVYVGIDLFFADERQVRRVLKQVSSYEAGQAASAEPLLLPMYDRLIAPVVIRFGRMMRSAGMAEYRNGLAASIVHAGQPGDIDVDRLLGIKALLTLLSGLVFLPLAFVALGRNDSLMALVYFAIVPLSFFLPDLWVSQLASRRRLAIRKSLPDMLDMLTISVEAGLGFDAALVKLVRKSEGPLQQEFGRMLQEIQAGVARKDAMRHLAERCDTPEVKTFATAIIQADVFGVAISHILKTQAAEMRLRRRQNAEEQAQKAPVKLVFPVILCIMPATLIVVVGPAAISFVKLFGS
jgi:tight adherence protein C